MKLLGITIALLMAGAPVHALEMVLGTPTFSGAAAGDPGLQSALNALANAIRDTFNDTIATASNESEFLKSVGNANATASRSFLTPGSAPLTGKYFMSVNGSAAVSLSSGGNLDKGISFPKNQLPPIGVAAQTGVTVGANAKSLNLPTILRMDPARTMYALSFLALNLGQSIGTGVSLKSTQISAGLSYQVYVPQSWTGLFRFNGIKVSSGLSYAKFDARYRTPFNLSQADGGSSMSWDSNIDIGVTSTVVSLSNEVITGIRAFWLANLYTGLGVDFNFGSSALNGGSSGPLVGTASGSTVYTNTATVQGSAPSQSPMIATTRFILGAQIDVGNFGLHTQVNIATPKTYGLKIGAHLMF